MELMNDPCFKTKYQKYKIRVKLWEGHFMEKYGRKPNKNDIKDADLTIREAYKIYWHLKTKALEETLTDINFHEEKNDIKSCENESCSNDKSTSAKIQSSVVKNYKCEVQTSSNHLKSKNNLDGRLNQHFSIEHNLEEDQRKLIERESSFHLSQKRFNSINFSKRNPRKSILITKFNKSAEITEIGNNQHEQKHCENNEYLSVFNSFEPSLNSLRIVNEKTDVSYEPVNTVEQLIEIYTKRNNKQLNSGWLDRCQSDDNEKKLLLQNKFQSVDEMKLLGLIYKSNSRIKMENSYNKSFSDDDYVCNSDSDEDHKYKRVRNSNRIYDFELPVIKKSCLNIYNETNLSPVKLDHFNHDINLKSSINYASLTSTLACTSTLNKNICNLGMAENKSFAEKINPNNISKSCETQIMESEKLPADIYKNNSTFSKCIKGTLVDQTQYTNVNRLNYKQKISNTSLNNQESISRSSRLLNTSISENCNEELKNTFETLTTNHNKQTSQSMFPLFITDKIEEKKHFQNVNENFVKINLKKKVFVRGKKNFNFSKYKKNQWKKKKKPQSSIKNRNYTYENSKNMCFKSTMCRDVDKQCKHYEHNELLPLHVNKNISSYPTLKEAENVTSISNCDSKIQTNINSTEQLDKIAFEDSRNFIEWENFEVENILEDTPQVPNELSVIKVEETSKKMQAVPPVYNLNTDGSLKDTPLEVLAALKKFGHCQFRDGQEKAIMRILSGLSTLVNLTTGSGKSLCYQLPAYIYAKKSKCITLVISPLVSLMDDQVSEIPNFLRAACLHTNQKLKMRKNVIENIRNGMLSILLISPETIVRESESDDISNLFKNFPPIAFACIDEAHCISQWSHNFRPAYLRICNVLKEKLGVKRILGLTATANKSTIMNLLNLFEIEDKISGLISKKNLPSNLNLSVSHDDVKDEALIKLLLSEKYAKCNSIIVYCTRREVCTRIAGLLRTFLKNSEMEQTNTVNRKTKVCMISEAYHAGLSSYRRRQIQNSFMKSETRIIVATVAFGMGINKSNIRSVIHYNMPSCFENYVQEIGRAGRDGIEAHCHLFLNQKENFDEYELRRHINSDKIDRHTIRRLLQKIFIQCCCSTLADSYVNVNCIWHEVAFPITEAVKDLDIPEETIITLLCYLELYSNNFIKLLSPSFINVEVSSYNGPKDLKLAAQSSAPLATAIALSTNKGLYNEYSSTIEFAVIDIATAIGWDSDKVKHHLKKLEWITVNGETKRSTIRVKFDTLGFRLKVRGNLSNEELDQALETLVQYNESQIIQRLRQLKYISIVLRKFSFTSIKECLEFSNDALRKSEELKNVIRNYFELDNLFYNFSTSPIQDQVTNEADIISDIHSLIVSYRSNKFTSRNIARIFHGIQSPNYPATVWSKCRFWRAHLNVDFDILCELAKKQILKIK